MSSWVVIPSLLALREEFNRVSPRRDKGADGTIADGNHDPTSDHTPDEDSAALRNRDSDRKNEVHALDIDSSGPWPDGKGGQEGGWFDRKIHELIAEERRRWLDPDDMCRLEYVIWRGWIYSRSRNFARRAYTGSDKHFNHAHFSARYETRAENDTRPWGVYVAPKPPTKGSTVATQFNADDKIELRNAAKDQFVQVTQTDSLGGKISAVGRGVLDSGIVAVTGEQRTPFYEAFRRLFAEVQALTTEVGLLRADLAVVKQQTLKLTDDPSEPGHPITEAVRYGVANP